jgi:hypothetical protein
MHNVYPTTKRTYPIRVVNDSGVVLGSGAMAGPKSIRNFGSAPAYIIARPAAVTTPRGSRLLEARGHQPRQSVPSAEFH